MPHRLENYLRTYRKKAGLSQRDVAVLLGAEDSAQVSRYEKRRRLPSLETALAYEVILGASVSELFAGVKESIEKRIARRSPKFTPGLAAHGLSQKLRSLTGHKCPTGTSPVSTLS